VNELLSRHQHGFMAGIDRVQLSC